MDLKKIAIFLLFVFITTPISLARDGLSLNQNVEVNVKQASEVQDKSIVKNINDLDEKTRAAIESEISIYRYYNNRLINNAKKKCKLRKRYIPTTKDLANKKYLKINLQDGDYIYWLPGESTAVEYHSNGELMGFVKIFIEEYDITPSLAFYEYRLDTPSNKRGYLKHIMIVRHETGHKYVYTNEGKLRTVQIDGHVITYDDLGMPSAVIDEKDLLTDEESKLSFTEKMKIKHDTNFFNGNDGYEGTSQAASWIMFSCYGGPAFFVVTPIILTGWIVSELMYAPVGIAGIPGEKKNKKKRIQKKVIQAIGNN